MLTQDEVGKLVPSGPTKPPVGPSPQFTGVAGPSDCSGQMAAILMEVFAGLSPLGYRLLEGRAVSQAYTQLVANGDWMDRSLILPTKAAPVSLAVLSSLLVPWDRSGHPARRKQGLRASGVKNMDSGA